MWWIIDEFLWQTKPGLAYWLATAPLSQRWKVCRVIGYDAQGFQVGHYDVQTLHQALYAQDVLEVKKGASAAVIYNKDGEELGGRNLDILRTLKRGQEK